MPLLPDRAITKLDVSAQRCPCGKDQSREALSDHMNFTGRYRLLPRKTRL